MKKVLVFFSLIIGFAASGQDKPKNLKTKIFMTTSDTIKIDTLSINPNYFKIYNEEDRLIKPNYYHVNYAKSHLILEDKIINSSNKIKVEYLPFPDFLTKTYSAFDKDLIVPKITDESKLYSFQVKNKNTFIKPFDGLYTSGSLSRGVTVGNNQDAVVNSNFNLQIEGKLSKNVGIRASITDNEIPLQEGGFTQRLDEFDKVFIELFSKDWSVIAGDIDLQNANSYLMRFQKKISGVLVKANIDHSSAKTDIFASGALVKGRFNSFKFNGSDGNQGPYKILGPDNEQFILMISGSERIFANGVLLKRGENFDYTIDYNTSEITFTTLYTVTSNIRFTIEYQIADRNYTRFLTYDGADFNSDKLKVGLKYFNETDSKNNTLQQDLTDDQKRILADAGDDQSKMIAPSAIPAVYAENKILYKKVSLNNQEFFEYSTDENDDLYQVSYSFVGENKGDYFIQTTLATGRVYAYVSEINGVKQGSYLPVIQLVAPEKLQMITVDAKYNPNEKTNFNSEIAFSDKDLNLFSNIDDDNNKGFATKINWQQIFRNKKKWTIKSDIDYEFIDKNFRTVERFRNVEFSRDWNINDITTVSDQKQQHALGKLSFSNDSIGSLNYLYENLIIGDDYKGNKHSFFSNLNLKNTKILVDGSALNNEDIIDENTFYRLYTSIIQTFSSTWFGAKYNFENNQIRDKITSEISNISHKYNEIEGFFGIGDSTGVYAEIGYNYRSTDSLLASKIQNVSKANTYFLKSKLIQSKNTDLALFVNYRTVKNVNIDDEESLNSRVTYRQGLFNNFINFNTFYETQSGNLPQQEFTYIEVEPGKGFYEWIDFNEDGIQDLDEFVIAQFQDQAKFVRVLLPNVNFIKTNKNKFSQTLNLNAIQWKNKEGIKKTISHFSNQAFFIIDAKTKRDESGLNLNPFSFDDDNLLSLDLNFKNSLFFNRGLQKYSMVYTFINLRKRSIFVFGDQDVKLLTHKFQLLHKMGNFWLLDITGGLGESNSRSTSFSNRNYQLDNYNINPKISYLYSKNSRLEAFYEYKNKENQLVDPSPGIAGGETLKMHVFGANFQYANKRKFSVNANLNIYFNEFNGNLNSPVAFQMLEGLQPGTNFTWLLSLQKRLTSFLDLNLNYFGRSSDTSKTIHSGSLQLRASF
jgi:hypothetical protein